MRHCGLVLLLAGSVSAFAQTPVPATPTLRTDVQLVSVDAVVTDKQGNPVRGLPQSAFAVREDKQVQTITSFEEHSTPAQRLPPQPGVFTNDIGVRNGAVNVILLDWLNTPHADQQYVRDQFVRFLQTDNGSVPTAVFAMGVDLRMLQDFTTDPSLLKQVIRRQGVKFSPLLKTDSGPSEEVQTLEDMIEGANPVLKAALIQVQQNTATADSLADAQKLQARVQYTLASLAQLARFLAGSTVRKNLIWISGSFPVTIQSDPQSTLLPFNGDENMAQQYRDVVNQFAANKVAVYPVDPSGVSAPPSQVSNSAPYRSVQAQQRMYGTASLTPQDDAYNNARYQGHITMNGLADGTGGRAFYDTNDLVGVFNTIQNQASMFYTLTYTPPPGAKPGQFRDIDVKVQGKGYHVAFRHGYYAAGAAKTTAASGSSAVVSRAMDPLRPQSSEVLITAKAAPVDDAPAGQIVGERIFQSKPHAQFRLDVSVDVKTLQMSPGSDGRMHATLEFATALYGADNKLLDSRQDRAALALEPARYQAMVAGGLRYHHFLMLPQTSKGDSIRIAVHDAVSDRVGTVSIGADALRGTEAQRNAAVKN